MRRILVPFHEQDADVPLDLHFTRHEDKAIEQTRNVVELGARIAIELRARQAFGH